MTRKSHKPKHKQPIKKQISESVGAAPIETIPENKKGIYSEYLDRNLTPDQLNAERKIQLKRISDLREGRAILVYASDLKKGGIAPIDINLSSRAK